MSEALTYFLTLMMFSYVIIGSARVSHDMLLLVCIPPVFVALITGFIMWVYTYNAFGPPLAIASVLLPIPVAWQFARKFNSRDMVITIYLAWALGMVLALIAFAFPDTE